MGPRRRKLDLAFEKAMDGVMGACNFGEVEKIFRLEESEALNWRNVLKCAHSKAAEHFQNKMTKIWVDTVDQFQVYAKLDTLDAGLANRNSGYNAISGLVQDDPNEIVKTISVPFKIERATKLASELEDLLQENAMLLQTLEAKRARIQTWSEHIRAVLNGWDVIVDRVWNLTRSGSDHHR